MNSEFVWWRASPIQSSRKWYPITFVASILWIAFFSYLMVWWANTIGETFVIPTEVSWIAFLKRKAFRCSFCRFDLLKVSASGGKKGGTCFKSSYKIFSIFNFFCCAGIRTLYSFESRPFIVTSVTWSVKKSILRVECRNID